MPAKKINKTPAKKTAKIKDDFTESVNSDVNVKKSFLANFDKRKLITILVIIAIVGILFYFKNLFIIATVNNEPISRIAVIKELEKQAGKQVVSSLITKVLIFQEAKKKNINVTEEEISIEVKKIEESVEKQGQKLEDLLAMQGMKREDLVEQIKIQKIVEKILSSNVKITDKEINDYIENNKNSLPEGQKPEELKESVKEMLKQQKLGNETQKWINELQSKANINYFLNY